MTVEALWTIRFGDVATPGSLANGGIVVLETGRVLGGDSGYAYVGSYSIKDGNISAQIKVIKHEPGWQDAFGTTDDEFDIELEGQLSQVHDEIRGAMGLVGTSGPRLGVLLRRFAELPTGVA